MQHRRSLLLSGALVVAACADPTSTATGRDATRVGYVEPPHVSGPPTLTVARPDGSGSRTLSFPHPAASYAAEYRVAWSPRWSPDGTRLAALGSWDTAPRELVVFPDSATGGTAFSTGLLAGDSRASLGPFDWSPDGGSLVVTHSALDIHAVPGCAVSNTILVVAATAEAVPRTVYASAGCSAPLAGLGAVGAVRWGVDGRIYFATSSAAAGRSRVLAVSAAGAASAPQVVRDSVAGRVFAIARSGAWALVLRDPVADTATGVTAGDYRQLVRVDLATGASTVLADRTRLPIPLLFPDDSRVPNDRIRWAQLTADDARIVIALNVEQGSVFGTRLQYRALTPDGRDAGALPGPPDAENFSVDLRP